MVWPLEANVAKQPPDDTAPETPSRSPKDAVREPRHQRSRRWRSRLLGAGLGGYAFWGLNYALSHFGLSQNDRWPLVPPVRFHGILMTTVEVSLSIAVALVIIGMPAVFVGSLVMAACKTWRYERDPVLHDRASDQPIRVMHWMYGAFKNSQQLPALFSDRRQETSTAPPAPPIKVEHSRKGRHRKRKKQRRKRPEIEISPDKSIDNNQHPAATTASSPPGPAQGVSREVFQEALLLALDQNRRTLEQLKRLERMFIDTTFERGFGISDDWNDGPAR